MSLRCDNLKHELSQFHGTENYYYHNLVRKFNYTDGVRHFFRNADTHGAYWFADIVATEFANLSTDDL